MSISDALFDVVLGTGIRPQSANRDDVQCAVSGAVTAPVEAMPGDFAGRGWHRASAAQRGKTGFRFQALGIVTCGQ